MDRLNQNNLISSYEIRLEYQRLKDLIEEDGLIPSYKGLFTERLVSQFRILRPFFIAQTEQEMNLAIKKGKLRGKLYASTAANHRFNGLSVGILEGMISQYSIRFDMSYVSEDRRKLIRKKEIYESNTSVEKFHYGLVTIIGQKSIKNTKTIFRLEKL